MTNYIKTNYNTTDNSTLRLVFRVTKMCEQLGITNDKIEQFVIDYLSEMSLDLCYEVIRQVRYQLA